VVHIPSKHAPSLKCIQFHFHDATEANLSDLGALLFIQQCIGLHIGRGAADIELLSALHIT
jgi:hypothetical protein